MEKMNMYTCGGAPLELYPEYKNPIYLQKNCLLVVVLGVLLLVLHSSKLGKVIVDCPCQKSRGSIGGINSNSGFNAINKTEEHN